MPTRFNARLGAKVCETPQIWEAVFALGSIAAIFMGMLWAYVAILKWGDG